MDAAEYFKAGHFTEALAALQAQVRSHPEETKHRIFLFQVLCVLGEWDRALNQLEVIAQQDAVALPMVHTYRAAIRCEEQRKAVFSGQIAPTIFGEPEFWVGLLVQAQKLISEGLYAEAEVLRSQAFELAPATSGVVDGENFEWIADLDSRLGPILEAIVEGNYYWIPFHKINEIRLDEPADLRDQVWMPVNFIWANGGEAVGLIPTRYSGSEQSDDANIRMARMTRWQEKEGETFLGEGQRMVSTDQSEFAIMDMRNIKLNER